MPQSYFQVFLSENRKISIFAVRRFVKLLFRDDPRDAAYTEVAMSCLFCKIIDGSIPSTAVYLDEECYAFADIHPQAPVHVLIVPRRHIDSIAQTTAEDRALVGHLHWVATEIAREKSLVNGYRTVINTNDDGGQTVDHLHVHLLGGRQMHWPPG